MSKRILSITLLLLSGCLCFLFSEGNRRLPSRRTSRCVKITNVNISNQVTGDTYSVSAASQGVKVIIFNTQYGQVCVNPENEWVEKIIANMTKGDASKNICCSQPPPK